MALNVKAETQLLSYVVQTKDMSLLEEGNYNPKDFTDEKQDFVKFLFEHKNRYGNVPDEETVIDRFPDAYSRVRVTESPQYLRDELKKNSEYLLFARAYNDVAPGIGNGTLDMSEAAAVLGNAFEEMRRKGGVAIGTDLAKDRTRLQEYEDRKAGEGALLMKTLIPSIDKHMGGLYPDELMVVGARINHGKSFIMLLLATHLFQQGHNVLFYAGEMETSNVGYRFDAINSGVSSSGLLRGYEHLSYKDGKGNYEEYLKTLGERENSFTILTPRDFDGRMPTPSDIANVTEKLKPDVIFIDQLSLMNDDNRSRDERIKYSNIMRDLRHHALTTLTPTVVASQVNREAATLDEDGDFTLPELHHLSESDAVGAYATSLITLCRSKTELSPTSSIIKMGIKKSRNGKVDEEWQMISDFDKGSFEEQEEGVEVQLRKGIDLKNEYDKDTIPSVTIGGINY